MNIVFWLISTLIVMLGPIILIHELAHFVLAKLVGVRAEEFGFGFPPRLLKLWRGKGYLEIGTARVSIPSGFRLPPDLGEGDQAEALVRRRSDGTYVLRRLEAGGAAANHRSIEDTAEDETFLRGTLSTLESGTLYSLNLLPVGAFVRMTGEEDPSDPRSLAAQPKRWRLAVLGAGPVVNIFVALTLLVGAYTAGYPAQWQVKVTRVEPGTAAEEAGLQAGDVITAAGGVRLDEGLGQLRRIIRDAPEQSLEFAVLRGGQRLTLTATPERRPEGYGFLGIMMRPWPDRSGLRSYRPPRAVKASVTDLARIAKRTLQLPIQLIQGDVSSREARPASMVGISQVMTFSLQQSLEWGLAFPALQTASLISLALALTNLLPLPALDGGRILFVLIEALRGRRVPPEREAAIHFIGMVILVGLMLLVMIQDLINPIIPWSLLK